MDFFFNTNEDLVLLKKDVLLKLKTMTSQFKDFFQHSQRSYKRNNPTKMNLDHYTLETLFFILCSRTLLKNNYNEYKDIMVKVLRSNYSTLSHPFEYKDIHSILDAIEQQFQTNKLFICFHNKMKRHVGGMLKTHQFKEVMDLYRHYLTPRYYEKKNLGQVFTPFVLIDRILDQIPCEVMSDPNSTFFDPSAGMGGFLVVLYKRLMSSLAHVMKDKDQRHNHIISNMLFASEITENNVAMMKKIFGNQLHIFHGDTLTINTKKEFGIDKFRVIVGNPPFEKPQKTETRKVAGDSLWDDFVRKSLNEWLLPDGYFGMLLPPGWRKPSDKKSTTRGLWELMTIKTTPLWIEMYNDKETKYYFEGNVAIRMDLVLLKNEKNNKKNYTVIKATDGNISKQHLFNFAFLPNAHLKEWKKILTKDKTQGVNVLYSTIYHTQTRDLKEEQDLHYKFPVIHSILKQNKKKLRYTNKKSKAGGFGVSKVIFNEFGGWNQPFLDWKGQFGMTQHAFALPISSKKEGETILNYFNQNKLDVFANDFNWSTSRPTVSWKLFRHVKKNFYNF